MNGNITVKDFVVHFLNNFPEEYNMILNSLENHLILIGPNALTIAVIYYKLNQKHEKISCKDENGKPKETALTVHGRQK